MKKLTKLLIPLTVATSCVAPITMTLTSCNSDKRKMNEIARKIKTDAIEIFENDIVKTHRETFNGGPIYDKIQSLMNSKAGFSQPTDHDDWSSNSAVQEAITAAGFTWKAYGNMWYDIPATSGREHQPTIILQCHTDMEMSGIKGILPGDNMIIDTAAQTIKTNGTVPLGADDGMAVATFISLAKHRNEFPHGPIRIIFSPDGGGEVVDPNSGSPITYSSGSDYLKHLDDTRLKLVFDSPYIINFDGTKQSNIYRSAAGIHRCNWHDEGSTTDIFESKTVSASDNISKYRITVKGLLGGHSGNQMNLGRASAIKLLTRIITISSDNFLITKLDCPQQSYYNICKEATVEFYAPTFGTVEELNARLSAFQTWFRSLYPVETGLIVTGQQLETGVTGNIQGLHHDLSFNLVLFINSIVFGPTNWFDKGHTQPLTSNNVGPVSVQIAGGKIVFDAHMTTRSALKADLGIFSEQVHELSKKLLLRSGESIDNHLTHSLSPTWERLNNNHLSNMLVNAYRYFKYNPVEFNTHSWVEAAVFPEMLKTAGHDNPYIATIGCTIVGSGTVKETVYLQTLDTPIKGIIYVLENAGGLPQE